MTQYEHFKASQVKAFLDDKLTSDEQDLFVAHLDRCDTCRQSLETAAGTHRWWAETKSNLQDRDSGASSPVAKNFQENAPLDDRIRRQLGQILAPSDDPRMLGRIGTYEVVGIIGRGGMGIVLKAFDPSLDRFVAIKVLAPEMSLTGAARERFAREARAAAAVTHENVIPIHAVSEFRGHGYIVIQYVPGRSLEQRIRQKGPLEINEALRIAMHVSRALAAAHQQGLVHRDIKPANILLEEGIDRPMVTDFGLARVATDASLTNSGVVSGTPNYMSPEQASGEHVDARSDLFSLGSVIYAMCVGHPPFRSDTVLGVLRRVSDNEPSSIRAQNPAVPSWLEVFVFRLLAKKPEDRFDSADEVARVLSAELAYRQNPTALAKPNRPWTREPKRSSRYRSSLVALTLIFSIVACIWAFAPFTLNTGTTSREHSSDPLQVQPLSSMSLDEWDFELHQAMETLVELEQAPPNDKSHVSPNAWAAEAARVQKLVDELEADAE